MRQTVLIVAAFTLALAPAALAADNTPVVGKWTSMVQTPRGASEVVYEFKEIDGELQGTWTNPRRNGDLIEVSWDGETLRFRRDVSVGGRTLRIDFEVTVDGDTMTGTMVTARREREFTANRSS